jgi:hypothetical protein
MDDGFQPNVSMIGMLLRMQRHGPLKLIFYRTPAEVPVDRRFDYPYKERRRFITLILEEPLVMGLLKRLVDAFSFEDFNKEKPVYPVLRKTDDGMLIVFVLKLRNGETVKGICEGSKNPFWRNQANNHIIPIEEVVGWRIRVWDRFS